MKSTLFSLARGSVVVSIFLSACVGTQNPAPVSLYGTTSGPGTTGVHVVHEGENLWSISKRYNVVMQDIVVSNNLHAPFVLNDGARLKLPAPRQHKVRSRDSVSSIARLYGVSASEIVSLNSIPAPYKLRVGQVVRLPGVTPKTMPAVMNTARALPPPTTETAAPVASVERTVLSPPEPAAKDAVSEAVMTEPQPDVEAPAQVQKASLTSRPAIPRDTPKRASSKFLQPVDGKIISNYGPKDDGLHNDGINIAAARGTPVKAADNGVVVYVGNEIKGSGNLILVRHQDRWMTAYGHLEHMKVQRGDTIRRGQVIGTVGSTGSVDTPQLHFEVRRGTDAINPSRYLES